MSLVDTFPFPPPHQILVKDGVVIPPRISIPFPQPTLQRPISLEERWAAQLAYLASQHQSSDYNRIKFGPQGCPMVYVPLSIQMPGYVKDLQARQVLRAKQKTWWPCRESTIEKATELPLVLGPCGVPTQSTVELQQEISAAIAAPLSSVARLPSPQSSLRPVKTSDTHPINVSTMIPFDLLPAISSHLSLPRRASPVMFEIPPMYTIDRITASQVTPYPSPTSFPSIPITESRSQFAQMRNRSSVSEALQAAINSGIAAAANGMVTPKGSYPWTDSFAKPLEIVYSTPSPTVISLHEVINLSDESNGVSRFPNNFKATVQLPVNVQPNVVSKSASFVLGNLFLSSCPGKKVRLNGPVRGRSTVCRDLDMDLKRMKDLGVRCIVCCLDDEELEFLGASWSEYSCAAEEIGLDILRIPIPEGFAPLTPLVLDAHLSKVIRNYTLNGIPILVHCRGGVGRAGLVACCWALKLGLCGWIETGTGMPGMVRRDTLQLVERMIGSIRRRRSVKAIETYEQVKFLVDYVEFLRERPTEGEGFSP